MKKEEILFIEQNENNIKTALEVVNDIERALKNVKTKLELKENVEHVMEGLSFAYVITNFLTYMRSNTKTCVEAFLQLKKLRLVEWSEEEKNNGKH